MKSRLNFLCRCLGVSCFSTIRSCPQEHRSRSFRCAWTVQGELLFDQDEHTFIHSLFMYLPILTIVSRQITLNLRVFNREVSF